MRRWIRLVPLAVVLGCSSLDEGEAGAVAIELRVPLPDTVEVSETLQLTAWGLNANGDSIGLAVTWLTSDPAILTVGSEDGLLTGVSPGSARVQARSGSLTSALTSFDVIAPADTLIIVGDSVFDVPADQAASPPLVVRVESFNPAGPVIGRAVIYEITDPPETAAPTVVLPGSVRIDTLTTAADGTVAGVTLARVAGAVAPPTAIVEIRASRTRGAVVPGSGQRFIIRFQ
ncbi:MAG: Ig-like domain-containing protein [Gemmatimonadales bacterium]